MTVPTYDFVVIVALDEEAAYFSDVVKCGRPFSLQDSTIWSIEDKYWSAFGRGALISSGGMGRDKAKASATMSVLELRAKIIANLGIAGRVDEDLSIGDVVVPSVCFDLTAGGKIGGTSGEVEFSHSPEQFSVEGGLVKIAQTHMKINSRQIESVNEKLRRRFDVNLVPEQGIRVISRPIACVPSVGANDHYRASIRKVHRAIAAMEMESAGILEAALANHTPAICVRGISDGADFNKRMLEQGFKDENRRFALEAALAVLETTLSISVEEAKSGQVAAVEFSHANSSSTAAGIEPAERLFSLLVRTSAGDAVENPIHEITEILTSPKYRGSMVLLGEKGSGKTTFFRHLYRALSARVGDPDASRESSGLSPFTVSLVRVRELEFWSNGELDHARTRSNLERAQAKLEEAAEDVSGNIIILIDGLSRTGPLRVQVVAELIDSLRRFEGVRLAISADNTLDLQSLYRHVAVDIQREFKLHPMDIQDKRIPDLVMKFSNFVGSRSTQGVVNEMRSKDVRSVDMFMMRQFTNVFRGVTYHGLTTLAQCYELFCESELSQALRLNEQERRGTLSQVAETAFEIFISKKKQLVDIKEQHVAQLISSHSSVVNYLVAAHVIGFMLREHTGKTAKRSGEILSYVFPAEVNAYMKQIMRSDRKVESKMIDFIKRRSRPLSTLARSHCAYLIGRVNKDRAPEMLLLLRDFAGQVRQADDSRIDRDTRMLRRTILISRSQLADPTADIEYAEILLSNVDEAEFNRGFHLEYYGDAPFEPDERMSSRDDGTLSCSRTLARLLDRIKSRTTQAALIELLTVLSLVQVRNQCHHLRHEDRESVLELLRSEQLSRRSALPPKVRGYLKRIEEDLHVDRFSLATVVEEWDQLCQTPRTGWLRRRRDAAGDALKYWTDRRVESVAEHCFSTMGIARTFLMSHPEGDEQYSKLRILEMLQIHDLAEAWLGDLLQADPVAEQEVLWRYGAFATYRGIGDLWRIPELFEEFSRGQTIDAKIARDLDRLQFMLQARLYRKGMSDEEQATCERTIGKLVTVTVNRISDLFATSPGSKRVRQNPIVM